MAERESGEAHSGSGERTAWNGDHAAQVDSRTRGLVKSEDSRMEELLHDGIQPPQDGEAGLVYSYAVDALVREKAPAAELA